jgi:hypothetical protein
MLMMLTSVYQALKIINGLDLMQLAHLTRHSLFPAQENELLRMNRLLEQYMGTKSKTNL